jgi:hypothetical protein
MEFLFAVVAVTVVALISHAAMEFGIDRHPGKVEPSESDA